MQTPNCDRCYRRKARCDKQQPICTSCERAGVPCVYVARTRERRYTADHVERLHERLRQAEDRNKSLANELNKVKTDAETHDDHEAIGESTSPPRQHSVVDAVSEVSYLSINAAGERQPYLGTTSGVLFATLIHSDVAGPAFSPSVTSPDECASPSVASRAEPVSTSRSFAELPGRAVAERLVAAFLEHDLIAYPFLSAQALSDTVEKFYGEEHYYSTRASSYEMFLFNMVLAVASAHVSKFAWQTLPSADSHQARAFAEMSSVLSHTSIESLQCLLLVCLWRTSSSVRDNSASMWHTVGIAVRMTLELGLHRESAYSIRTAPGLGVEKVQAFSRQELARRCFWCVVAMDRITSNILGRPLGLAYEDIDAELPSMNNSDILMRPLSATVAGVSRIAIFNQIIRYRLLCGKLITHLHRKRSVNVSIEDAINVRYRLAEELDQWYGDVQCLQLSATEAVEATEQSCFTRPIWYEVIYANAKLMVWRPCPLLADLANDRDTLQRIHDSATHAIQAYAKLHRDRSINYSWVTLQSVFMAGLSYIYAVGRHIRDRQAVPTAEMCLLDKDPATIDVVTVTRACSNVLVAIAERWNTQRHCHDVFDRLSDAVLADAIKLQTASAPSIRAATAPQGVATAIAMSQTAMEMPMHSPTQIQPVPSLPGFNHWSSQPPAMQSQQRPEVMMETFDASPLAVDDAFLHCYGDIQNLYQQQQLEDPVMHLSQDWLSYLGGGDYGGANLLGADIPTTAFDAPSSYPLTNMNSHLPHG